MTTQDPLTMRHGAYISQVWSMIQEARDLACKEPTSAQCATQLRRIRYLRRKVLSVHRIEMQRDDASTPAIDGWFKPVEDCLEKAERYFAERVQAASLTRQMDFLPDGTRKTHLA